MGCAAWIIHPAAGWLDNVMPVTMLERQNHPARGVAIQERGPATRPRTGDRNAIVAMNGIRCIGRAGKRNTTKIADQSADKGRVAPASGAKPEIAFDHATTTQAARRVDKAQGRLKLTRHPPISR